MTRFNLLHEGAPPTMWLRLVAGVGAAVMLAIVIVAPLLSSQNAERLETLEARRAQLEVFAAQAIKAQQLESHRRELLGWKQRLLLSQTSLRSAGCWLASLGETVPPGLEIAEAGRDGSNVHLSGWSHVAGATASLLAKLSESGGIHQASSFEVDRETSGASKVRFSLDVVMQ